MGIGSSVPYIASKGAINAMTLHFARALAPEVRVNAVCPGLVTTRWFAQGAGQESYEKLKAASKRSDRPRTTTASAVWSIDQTATRAEILERFLSARLRAQEPRDCQFARESVR